MKVEELIQAIEELTQEEKAQLIIALMPKIYQTLMADPGFTQRMMKQCRSMMQDSAVRERMPPGMRQIMEMMMGRGDGQKED